MPRVFLLTGTSSGFGQFYAQEVLDRGDIVVATARDPSGLRFSGAREDNYLALRLDVVDRASIAAAFAATLARFGRVDVVVNNAGYGLAGAFEEYTDEQVRRQMEVNFFGVLDVTREALAVMRDRQTPPGGLIQQITSIGGQRGVPLFTAYCASKWAVEGFTEALSHELKPEWGIKLSLIEPGGFRYVGPSLFRRPGVVCQEKEVGHRAVRGVSSVGLLGLPPLDLWCRKEKMADPPSQQNRLGRPFHDLCEASSRL